MTTKHYDTIIIGSGAGGAAAAYRLALAGQQVLLLEKGGALAPDGSTLDVDKVIRQGLFKSRETWRDGRGRPLVPEEYFNLGGKTKWYGAALLRFSEEEFDADETRKFNGWPISYRDLEPYYAEAESLLGVRCFDCEPDLARLAGSLGRYGWRSEALPLGLAPAILQHRYEAQHFDGFASALALKGDAETALLARLRDHTNLTVMAGIPVTQLLSAERDPARVTGVALADGSRYFATAVVLAAGALHSPRLLQSYLQDTGLERSLPSAKQVGCSLKLHLLTAVLAISPGRKTDLLRKTSLLLHDRFPRSSVQPLGFDGELIATLVPKFVPRWLATNLGTRAYGLFLQTEDGSDPGNRVLAGDERTGTTATLDYMSARVASSLTEHRRLVWTLLLHLAGAGYLSFSRRIPVHGTAHACGTLAAGVDPCTSVVDGNGRVHGMRGLYVVDGSVLPRSSRVNPSLTIYAWALRVADGLLHSLRAAA